MSEKTSEEVFSAVQKLMREVGAFQLEQQTHVYENQLNPDIVKSKGADGPFSFVDKKSEDMLKAGLLEIYAVDFRGEESTEWNPWKGLCWLVDPLDGTYSYMWNKNHWSISVALMEGNEVKMGFVYNPPRDWLYMYDAETKSATKNLEPIQCNGANRIICGTSNKAKPIFKEKFHYLWQGNGSAALAAAFIADGSIGGYLGLTEKEGMREWDVAAGFPLLEAAGGKIVFLEGNSSFNKSSPVVGDFIMGTAEFVDELFKKLDEHGPYKSNPNNTDL